MIIYELDRTNLQVRENNDRLRLYFIIVLVNVYYDYILFDIRATYDQFNLDDKTAISCKINTESFLFLKSSLYL